MGMNVILSPQLVRKPLPKIKRKARGEETLKEDVKSLAREWSIQEDIAKIRQIFKR